MIFNCRGKIFNEFAFSVGGCPVEIVDNYQYLGIKLRPSGSMQLATDDLFSKANRAWFAISNVLYQHKKLAVHKALQLFDSLIKPIFLYANIHVTHSTPCNRRNISSRMMKCIRM